jgi:hypothetical protein
MESGRFRQRRRFTVDHTLVDITWELTDTELGVFEAFCEHRLAQCTSWFEIELPLGGTGMAKHVARFVEGKYKISYEPVSHWKVQARLEVEDVKRFDNTTLEIYLLLGYSESELLNLIGIIDETHRVIHEVLPANLN